jgi:cytochrome c oxidase assembly protein subunit 15
VALLVALALQLTLGAFMAGLKAALIAPTWPSINGAYWPVFDDTAAWFNDPLAVHFAHRNLAYVVALSLLGWWWASRKTLGLERHLVLGLVGLQVLLGVVVTVRAVVPRELVLFGVLHQLVATSLVVALTWAVFRVRMARVSS